MTTDAAPPLLAVEGLVKHYRARRHRGRRPAASVIHALCGPTFQLDRGETFGVVGESGSGKTTLLRTILGLETPTAGRVLFDGVDVTGLPNDRHAQTFRRAVSVVFQDPYMSLDPRMTVADILREPAQVHRQPFPDNRIGELLDQVRLPRTSMGRFPHEFSGGQRQRIAIARSLALDPALVVLDEPVSSLDVSVQAEILALLQDLQQSRQVAYLLVAHDLALVADISHRVGVMYGGQMVEQGPAGSVIRTPGHPYSQALLAAVPVPDPHVQRTRLHTPPPPWPRPDSPAADCSFGDVV